MSHSGTDGEQVIGVDCRGFRISKEIWGRCPDLKVRSHIQVLGGTRRKYNIKKVKEKRILHRKLELFVLNTSSSKVGTKRKHCDHNMEVTGEQIICILWGEV